MGLHQNGEIQTLSGGGQERASPASPSAGLTVRNDRQTVFHLIDGQPLDLIVGGIQTVIVKNLPPHLPGSDIGQRFLRHDVRHPHQTVTAVGTGIDSVPVLPQRFHGFPYSRPADAQLCADPLPGKIGVLSGFQQL